MSYIVGGRTIDNVSVKPDLPDEDYFKAAHFSKSKLSSIAISPLKFWFLNINPERPERVETEAMRIGSATHYAILEPEKFEKEVVCEPELNRRTKVGKEQAAAFKEANQGKLIIKKSEYDNVRAMQDAVRKSQPMALSTISQTELAIFAAIDGVPVKGKIDAVAPGGVLLDLKTTEDASESGFAKSVRKYRYDVQAGLYSALYSAYLGKKAGPFWFLCVEKKPPFATAMYKLDDEYIIHGIKTFYRWMDIYQRCAQNNHWPDYNNGMKATITMPEWMKDERKNN